MKKLLCLIVLLVVTMCDATAATKCSGIDRTLTHEAKVRLAPIVAQQLNTPTVDVLESFRTNKWTILYVDPHTADEAFLFYPQSPSDGQFQTLWSGAARPDEEEEIHHWVLQNAPGVPARLASCFAWHVTHDRDK
jgi:hypothetical protein